MEKLELTLRKLFHLLRRIVTSNNPISRSRVPSVVSNSFKRQGSATRANSIVPATEIEEEDENSISSFSFKINGSPTRANSIVPSAFREEDNEGYMQVKQGTTTRANSIVASNQNSVTYKRQGSSSRASPTNHQEDSTLCLSPEQNEEDPQPQHMNQRSLSAISEPGNHSRSSSQTLTESPSRSYSIAAPQSAPATTSDTWESEKTESRTSSASSLNAEAPAFYPAQKTFNVYAQEFVPTGILKTNETVATVNQVC